MNREFEENIKQMRQASIVQNWDIYKQGLQSLVCEIKHEVLLTFALKYTKRFIEDFLQMEPEFRNNFNPFVSIEPENISSQAIDSICKATEGHKGKPGINNFRRAISKTLKLFQLEYCSSTYIETFVTIISNLFISIPSQRWGRENPELYNQWLYGTKTEDLLILLKYYYSDPKQVEIERGLWIELVDDIETILSHIERPSQ